MAKWVYSFGSATEGDASMGGLLGVKGANLAEMSRIGLPVPPGFTITTEACTRYIGGDQALPKGLEDEVAGALAAIEAETGLAFADPSRPLLLSVRSGAAASMPGMMDTVLNLGLNEAVVRGLEAGTGDARFARDTWRRFIHMHAEVALGVDGGLFEDALEDLGDEKGVGDESGLNADDLGELAGRYLQIVRDETGGEFPDDPMAQLWGAVRAVLDSWMNPRAVTYRSLHGIPESPGTAVNIQAMVFGNMGEGSAAGVAFTRNPSTGEKGLFGEYIANAQGEDVVAGIRTPTRLTKAGREADGGDGLSLEEAMPEAFAELTEIRSLIEGHFRDMQDFEFTIQQGRLHMLQTRAGKRTAEAALRIAVDMAEEGVISREEAILMVDASSLEQLLHPGLDRAAAPPALTKGLPASPGVAVGEIALTADRAVELAAAKRPVVLVRPETSPDDIHGMHAADGILTARGGMTSHAAVVARGMGRACVCGARDVRIDAKEGTVRIKVAELGAGDTITIDGGTGEVYAGSLATVQPELPGTYDTLIAWAEELGALAGEAGREPIVRLEAAQASVRGRK